MTKTTAPAALSVTNLALGDIVIDEQLDFRSTGTDLAELQASIADHGLLQPIVVAPANGDGKHHVIAGRRRYRAFEALGLKTIPAIVRADLSDERSQVVAQAIENLQREDISILDEARTYSHLLTLDVNQKEVARLVGKSSSHVSGRLALLKLPERIVHAVEKGDLAPAIAAKLARAPKPVRDKLAKGQIHHIDERSIAAETRNLEAYKERKEFAEVLAEQGVKAYAEPDNYPAHYGTDLLAELIGLTDEDKPKTHSWVNAGYEWATHYATPTEHIKAIVAQKPKGAYISQSGGTIRIQLLDSANVDLERRKQQEERDAEIEARRAVEEQERQAFNEAVTSIVAAPDKAGFLAGMLRDQLAEDLGVDYGWNQLSEESFQQVWARLGGGDYDESQSTVDRLWTRASKSVTDMVRVSLALEMSHSPALVRQGLPASLVPVRMQFEYVQNGVATEDWMTDEGRAFLAERRAEEEARQAEAEAEPDLEELEARYDAEVEARLTAAIAEAGDDVTDDEVATMRTTIEAAVEAEVYGE